MRLTFGDDSVVEADCVVDCDGVESKVCQQVLGGDHPALSTKNHSNVMTDTPLILMDIARPLLDAVFTMNVRDCYRAPRAYGAVTSGIDVWWTCQT